jgi:hypothetical protein
MGIILKTCTINLEPLNDGFKICDCLAVKNKFAKGLVAI